MWIKSASETTYPFFSNSLTNKNISFSSFIRPAMAVCLFYQDNKEVVLTMCSRLFALPSFTPASLIIIIQVDNEWSNN